MFDQFTVRHMVSGASFSGARKILAQGKVSHVFASGSRRSLLIMGRVEDPSGDAKYDSYVQVDTRDGVLLEKSCDCPQAENSDEPCMHCTALLLYYAQHPDILQTGVVDAGADRSDSDAGSSAGSSDSFADTDDTSWDDTDAGADSDDSSWEQEDDSWQDTDTYDTYQDEDSRGTTSRTYSGPSDYDLLREQILQHNAKEQQDDDPFSRLGSTGDVIDADWRPYDEDKGTRDQEDDDVSSPAPAKSPNLPAGRATAADAAGLLRSYEKLAMAGTELGKSPEIELVPYAQLTDEGLTLQFRIGSARKYIVKNIRDLATAIDEHSVVRYGKFLEFKHDLSAFSESSRPIAKFLQRVFRIRLAQEKARGGPSYVYSYGYGSQDTRTMLLDAAELDDFMETMASAGKKAPAPADTVVQLMLPAGKDDSGAAPAAASPDAVSQDGEPAAPASSSGTALVPADAGTALEAPGDTSPDDAPKIPEPAGAGFYFDYDGRSLSLDEYRLIHVAFDMPRFLLRLKKEEGGMSFTFDDLGIRLLTSEQYAYFFDKSYVHRVSLDEVAELLPFFNYIRTGGSTYFAAKDLPSFTENLLPVLRDHFDIDYGDFQPALYESPDVSFRIDLDNPQRDLITCYLTAVYEDTNSDGTVTKRAYAVFSDTSGIGDRRPRNRRQEAITGSAVSSYFTAFDRSAGICVYQADEDAITVFIAEVIPKLEKIAPVYLSNTLKHSGVITPSIKVGVSFHLDLLQVDLVSDELTLPQIAEILSRYDPKKKYYRLTDGDIVRFSGEAADELAAFQDGLGLKEQDIAAGDLKVPAYRAMYLDSLQDDRDLFKFSTDDGFRKLVDEMRDTPGAADCAYTLPKSLEHVLRGYQKDGFYWLARLKSHGFGGILADQMGLGKTLQVLTLLLAIKEKEGSVHALIVCPASLVYNWGSEIEKFTPSLSFEMMTGSKAFRRSVLKDMDASGTSILISSYDTLKRDIDLYADIHFDCQVLDEAQYIKNPDTQQAKAAKSIDADFHLAMTGTPIENRLSELWSIFDYCMPGFLFTYPKFREKFEVPGMNELLSPVSDPLTGKEGQGNSAASGDAESAAQGSGADAASAVTPEQAAAQHVHSEALSALRKMVAPFILRRLKKDVLADLPDKDEETVFAQLEGEQKDLYQAHMQRLKVLLQDTSDAEFNRGGRFLILSELTRLRQLCCDPSLVYKDYRGNSAKSDLCIDLIRSATEEGHQVLLFSQFTSMLDNLEKRLKKEKISFFTLYGSTPSKERFQLVEDFQKGGAQVFCISLKAGGTGLNLTAADIVIHYDPWWNSAAEEQATDRAHRIGQKNTVTVYKLLMKDTIEERIHEMQENKNMLADEILRGEEIKDASFTRESLMKILEG